MNTHQRDPIADYFDQLAHVADGDLVSDRLPGIQRRVQQARVRKTGVALAAAAVATVGGVGLWQGMPTDEDRGVTVAPDLSQTIDLQAVAQGTSTISITFAVSGAATVPFDPGAGKWWDHAEATSVVVRVDGRRVFDDDTLGAECRAGGAVAAYSQNFPPAEPLVVPVDFAGEHKVVVKATYCADGQLVETVDRATVMTVGAPTVVDRLKPDLDGDGVGESVKLIQAANPADDLTLEVIWEDGSSQSAAMPNTMERRLEAVDLDEDGDQEIVVIGGGGDTSEIVVFVVDRGDLVEASYVDAEGQPLEGLYGGAVPTDWNVSWVFGGIYSSRNPNTGPYPAPLELRLWTLSGRTLTEETATTEGCLTEGGSISLGPCSG